ncbi:PspC domain-containing protein [Micromonospora musae]|uniref:PspC domain-containing protein n=1 Tax=Micromonospora musae TaxID=1894970 RepID=UPI0018F3B3AF|nr:PspC domain-containing protein [Micromonospora musae]
MTEEAAQSPRAGVAPPGGATPPPGSPGWTGPAPAGPPPGAGPGPGPTDAGPGPAWYGPGPETAGAGPTPGFGPGGTGPAFGPGGGGTGPASGFGGGGTGPAFGPGGGGTGPASGFGGGGTGPAFGSGGGDPGPAFGFAGGGGGGGGTPPPPPGGPGGAAGGPPPGAFGFTTRYGLVRPRDGRYLAGVCAAIGRATNTDPVLWRVLLAVLGFFGGVGILVYIAAWLIIPGEGDTASPIESMLGRGRSSMSPVTVIVLGIVAAVGFGYIVTDAFRAVLLGAAILIGGALLLNRGHRRSQPAPAGPPPAPPGPVPPVSYPAPTQYAAPPTADLSAMPGAPAPGVGPQPQPSPGPEAREVIAPHGGSAPQPQAGAPVSGQPADRTAELPSWPPAQPTAPQWGAPAAPGWPAPTGPASDPFGGGQPGGGHTPTAPMPPTGYRPPFAPHGPYATQSPGAAPPAKPPKPPKPPKRPKERSALGAVTFSLIFLALGLVVILDLLNVFDVGASAYFAAALATIGVGLLVGTWFGRARWLIALGLVTAAALAVATVAESYDRFRGVDGAVTWAPSSYQDLATRYENSFGDAVLDLRSVDFAGHNAEITVSVNFGQGTVVVPQNVDVTTVTDVNAGDATVFGQHQAGAAGGSREFSDLGADGAGGGTLRLFVHINAGSLVVTR